MISMPLTIRSTAGGWGAFVTATMATTAICCCIFSRASIGSARLRSSNIDASGASREEVERIVIRFVTVGPQCESSCEAIPASARDALMNWCETNHVDDVFGLARNQRLRQIIDAQMTVARLLQEQTQQAARVFTEFVYETRDSWTCSRPVIAKAEYLAKGETPACGDVARCAMFIMVLMAVTAVAVQANTVSFSDNFMPGPSSSWNNYAGNWGPVAASSTLGFQRIVPVRTRVCATISRTTP